MVLKKFGAYFFSCQINDFTVQDLELFFRIFLCKFDIMLNLSNLFIIWFITRISIMTIVSVCHTTWSLSRFHTFRTTSSSTSSFISIFSTVSSKFGISWKSFFIMISIEFTSKCTLFRSSSDDWILFFIGISIWTGLVTLLICSIRESFSCIGTCICSFLSTISWITILLITTYLSWIMWLVFVLTLAVGVHVTNIYFNHVLHIISFLRSRTSSSSSILHLLISSSSSEGWVLFPLEIILFKVIILDSKMNLWVEVFIINLRKARLKTLSV